MFNDCDFVECIQNIEPLIEAEDPNLFPKKGVIYTLVDFYQHPDFEDSTLLDLEELPELSWNADFFRPITRKIIDELLDVSLPITENIEADLFKKLNKVEEDA